MGLTVWKAYYQPAQTKTTGRDREENRGGGNRRQGKTPTLPSQRPSTCLGTVFFLFLFNIGISFFVFLLTGIMIFSQVLFIIYAMFLPVSFLLSMVPSFEGMSKRAITKLFNTILTRAGITLIITVAFSISTMLYNLSGEYPFFLTAFLQIVTFAGIYFKLGDLMGMFSLQSGDSQSMGSRIMRRPRMLMHAQMHRLQNKLGRSVAALGAGTAAYHARKQAGSNQRTASIPPGASKRTQADHSRPDGQAAPEKESVWKRAGSAVGAAADTKDKIADTAGQLREQAKDLPVNAKYALYHGKTQVSEGVRDFDLQRDPAPNCQSGTTKCTGRKPQTDHCRTQGRTGTGKTAATESFRITEGAAPVHERPVTAKQPEDFLTSCIYHSYRKACFPIHQGTGTGFLWGNCGRTDFCSGGKGGFHPL